MSGARPEDSGQYGYPNPGQPQPSQRYGGQPPPVYGPDSTVTAAQALPVQEGMSGTVSERGREPAGYVAEAVQQPGGASPDRYQNYDPNVVFGLPAHPQATTILILGIVGLFIFVTAPAAWIMGNKARRELRQFPGRYQETSSLTVGWVLGIIGTAELILLALAFAVIILGAIMVAFTQL